MVILPVPVRVRGQALRVDLVTPARGGASSPVPIPRLNAAAAPLHFLDYLLEDVQPAAVIDGGGILVSVPHPARFAVHKLLVAQDRPPAFQSKSRKDVTQAAQLLLALDELRPGEASLTASNAVERGKGWTRALQRGLAMLERVDGKAASIVVDGLNRGRK